MKYFYRTNCPKCPAAKAIVDELGDVEHFDLDTRQGLAKAAFYNVISTPTVIVVDDDGKEVASWRGDPPPRDALLSSLSR